MRAASLCFCVVAIPAVVVLAGCTKQDEKAVKEEPKKATPVTSADLGSFNDFLPQTGGAAGLAVKLDGGLEGGAIANVGGGTGGGDSAGAGAGAGAGAPNPEEKLKVTEQGAEPRAPRKYTFVANRVDKRIFTIQQEQARGGPGGGGGLTLAIALDFAPKKIQPSGSHWEGKITKVDLPGAAQGAAQQAQLSQALGGLNGLVSSFDLSPHGEVGEVSFAGDQKLQNPLAEAVVQGVQQIMQVLVAPFPDQPIGVGAKWERSVDKEEGGVRQQAKHAFTLKEVNAEGGVVEAEIVLNVPKRALQARGVPPGATIAIDGSGKYTYQFRFDRLATKVEGELKVKQHLEAPDQSGKKQVMDEVQNVKHKIDTPPNAK